MIPVWTRGRKKRVRGFEGDTRVQGWLTAIADSSITASKHLSITAYKGLKGIQGFEGKISCYVLGFKF